MKSQMSEKVLLLAREDIIRVLQYELPNLSYEQHFKLANQVLDTVDWDNPAQMHKGLTWITETWCKRNIPGYRCRRTDKITAMHTIRKDASDALEILLQHFDGERPAPFDKVIEKLMAIETAAIKMQGGNPQ